MDGEKYRERRRGGASVTIIRAVYFISSIINY
jgi:hypothetical protein